MDDIEIGLKKYEDRRALKSQMKFKLIADTMGHDGRLIWELMSLKVAQRFGIGLDNVMHSPCHLIALHYIESEDIGLDFVEWLYCDNAPFLKPLHKIGKYFPELKPFAKDDREIVRLANKVYGLELKVDEDWYTEYVYAYGLDFNSFTPVNLGEVNELKREIDFCKKYGLETGELEEKLSDYGLPVDIF